MGVGPSIVAEDTDHCLEGLSRNPTGKGLLSSKEVGE